MQKIESEKIVTVDCDDTLVMWDVSKYHSSGLESVSVECYGYQSSLYVNQKNVNLVTKLAKLGYTIVVWSQSGADWAEAVAKAVGLDPFVAYCMAKPRYHVDDLPASVWLGVRLWRDPLTGGSDDEYNKSESRK